MKEEKIAKEVERRIQNLIALVVRGVVMRQPERVLVHGHGDTLFIRAEMALIPGEMSPGVLEMALFRCKDFTITPVTEFVPLDFKNEWPPYGLIRELERKIILPAGV
jgi:hypothetical protein